MNKIKPYNDMFFIEKRVEMLIVFLRLYFIIHGLVFVINMFSKAIWESNHIHAFFNIIRIFKINLAKKIKWWIKLPKILSSTTALKVYLCLNLQNIFIWLEFQCYRLPNYLSLKNISKNIIYKSLTKYWQAFTSAN